jgi:hypothetical protein
MENTSQVTGNTCKICQKTGMKRLGFHVRKKHGLSIKEYEKWPEKPPINNKQKRPLILSFLKRIFVRKVVRP